MTEKVGPFNGGPFNGLFRKLENFELAEVFITEKGTGYEFTKGEFVAATGVKESSALRILMRLVEAGILASYPHPKHHNVYLYRVAWPVIITQEAVSTVAIDKASDAHTFTVPEVREGARMGTYEVEVKNPVTGETWEFVDIKAASPSLAAQKVRDSIKATVIQVWTEL